MSVLISQDDLKGGGGAPLPIRPYRGTVESGSIEALATGRRMRLQIGNIRTLDGATEFDNGGSLYQIKNRKVFGKHWVTQDNPQAQQIGNREIKTLAVSSGIVPTPAKGAPVQLEQYNSFDEFAEAIVQAVVGRDVTFYPKHETYEKNGETRTDTVPARYLQP